MAEVKRIKVPVELDWGKIADVLDEGAALAATASHELAKLVDRITGFADKLREFDEAEESPIHWYHR